MSHAKPLGPAELTLSTSAPAKPAGPAVTTARLANGLDIVVIPDHRAPVVTHMVWYRNGSADDPVGKSGIAHFLEHLMFKGTKDHPAGKFSELIADLGGQENAFTSNDYTAYFQRAAKEHLKVCMDYEADRMSNLVLTDEVVKPERDVVLEERRMRTDSDPADLLNEAVQAALFTRHPYGTPVIGWADDIEGLGRADALAYYERFYTPENAILIVAGDVDPAAVIDLATTVYGSIPARGAAPKRFRPREPDIHAHRLVTLLDQKVEQPSYQTVFRVPSYRTAARGEAEALEVLAHFLGGGQASLLFKTSRHRQEDRGLRRRPLRRHGARRHALLRLCLARARRLARDPRQRDRKDHRRGGEKGHRGGRSRPRQDAARRRRDLCAGQSGGARAMVWRFACRRSCAYGYCVLARADRSGHGGRCREGSALARPAVQRHRLSPARAGGCGMRWLIT